MLCCDALLVDHVTTGYGGQKMAEMQLLHPLATHQTYFGNLNITSLFTLLEVRVFDWPKH